MRQISDETLIETTNAFRQSGGNKAAAARLLDISVETFKSRYRSAVRYGIADDSAILEAANAGGVENPDNLSHFWKLAKDENGNGYSLFIKNPNAGGNDILFADMVRNAIAEGLTKPPKFEPRKAPAKGECLLVVDLADVHFLKLCVKSETGYEYNREIARHRVIEGTKALLAMAKPFGIHKILFVMGNDILHVDNPHKTTTSGTGQDVEGSIFQGYGDAKAALCDAVKLCADVADVDLVHCMSNHDWTVGWTLSQTVAALFTNHPNVNASDYNISERHRKYYRFGNNLFGLTHGDGTKEEKLYGHMVKEARQHISECQNLYWLLHHVHHKIRKRRGDEKPYMTGKDHNGMTAIMAGAGNNEGENIHIEYVRSPSPPDGWHDRNGYVNRQGVECFVYHPHDGQKARFTEWF